MNGRNGAVLVIAALLVWIVHRVRDGTETQTFDPILLQIVYLLGLFGLAMILVGVFRRSLSTISRRIR